MFKVKIGEDEYEVNFKHYVPPKRRIGWTKEEFRNQFGTVCTITGISNADIDIFIGNANLSIKDNFSRNVGRKVSLSKALQQLFPDNSGKRSIFWRTYYQTRGNKW